jgi:hypothetical protein
MSVGMDIGRILNLAGEDMLKCVGSVCEAILVVTDDN